MQKQLLKQRKSETHRKIQNLLMCTKHIFFSVEHSKRQKLTSHLVLLEKLKKKPFLHSQCSENQIQKSKLYPTGTCLKKSMKKTFSIRLQQLCLHRHFNSAHVRVWSLVAETLSTFQSKCMTLVLTNCKRWVVNT